MESATGWETVYRRAEDVVSRRIAGEVLLVPVRGRLADMQRMFSLNTLGSFIWDRLDGATTLGDIRKDVADNFEVSAEQAGEDAYAFVRELLREGLVTEQT